MQHALLVLLCLLFAGCSSTNAVGEQEARERAAKVQGEWKAELARGAREEPARRFQNLPQARLLRRLRTAAERYDFEVTEVEFLRPRQLAPRVVVRSEDVERLARNYRMFSRSIDPKERTADDREGWAYEGFLFEAQDADGVPAFVVFHWWRAQTSVGGGQWARTESLFPFAHG